MNYASAPNSEYYLPPLFSHRPHHNKMSISNTHLFFCISTDCGNTAVAGTMCHECASWSVACPDCGDRGATVLGSNYCHECFSKRNHPCNAPPAADGWCPRCDIYTVVLPNICDRCQQKCDDVCRCDGGDEPCDHCARYLADKAEEDIWCGVDECDDCGAPVKDGRMTCLCWADEEALARMDRDLALHH